jgi:hypothetical protein
MGRGSIFLDVNETGLRLLRIFPRPSPDEKRGRPYILRPLQKTGKALLKTFPSRFLCCVCHHNRLGPSRLSNFPFAVADRQYPPSSLSTFEPSPAHLAPGVNPAILLPMATRKLTPVEVLLRLQQRLEKRMEATQRVKLEGFEIVISELETEMDYLRRATRYLDQ